MKKLYKVKIEYETFVLADDEEEATEKFWEDRSDCQDIDTFLNDIVSVERVELVDELLEEPIVISKTDLECLNSGEQITVDDIISIEVDNEKK